MQLMAGLESEYGDILVRVVAKIAIQMQGGEGSPGGPGIVQPFFQRCERRWVEQLQFHQATQIAECFQ
jgi:hypothetical protein